jgi:lysophospholipase L1-like esterase
MPSNTIRLVLASAIALTAVAAHAQNSPTLKDGDRVVFYGDSITAQHLYTRYTEDYILTRYPKLQVTFFNAGMGGDRVTGGGAGPIAQRLERDVFPLKPTVITIMLGMNDGGYKPDDPETRKRYEDGYRHIVQTLKARLPEARIYLIQPSPYDEITKTPKAPGYNSVLIGYSHILAQIAQDEHVYLIDGNTPIVDELHRAVTVDPVMAAHILPDSVHPQGPGHWVLATAIVKAWGVTPIVDTVTLNAKSHKAETDRAMVSDAKTDPDGTITWTETDEALPLPLDQSTEEARFLFKISDIAKMDQQILKVTHLKAAKYALTIDTTKVGEFTPAELEAGINLATQITPMTTQALQVDKMGNDRATLDSTRFSLLFQGKDVEDREAADRALRAFDATKWTQQVAKAQPTAHTFHLAPMN